MIRIGNLLLLAFCLITMCNGLCFQTTKRITPSTWTGQSSISTSLSMSSNTDSTSSTSTTSSTNTNNNNKLKENIKELKKVLYKEYTTFFNPMYKEYYKDDVTFIDPLTNLVGVSQYENNVNMLAGRTLMGNILFDDGGISLHSVTGGDVIEDKDGDAIGISDIITRWTLRVTAKILPWKPKAQFTGISVYKVSQSSSALGIEIIGQEDYWDSINLSEDGSGTYTTAPKTKAIDDFLGQLKPSGYKAELLAPELPYLLLRRGNGYQVRKYPSSAVCTMTYNRRDEAFADLGSFVENNNVKPLSPALIQVYSKEKTMSWPISYAKPGEEIPTIPSSLSSNEKINIETISSQTMAVIQFDETSTEQAVRKYDSILREYLKRDGLIVSSSENEKLIFAQYDAIYSLGKRRNEVWILLDSDSGVNPW